MSLSHDSFVFGSHLHTQVEAETPFELPIRVFTFAGAGGELHLIDELKGRTLGCNLTASGYATQALLEAFLQTVHARAGVLVGTLTADGVTFPACTFLGIIPIEPAFLDGTGTYGWVQRVRLNWRQRSRT